MTNKTIALLSIALYTLPAAAMENDNSKKRKHENIIVLPNKKQKKDEYAVVSAPLVTIHEAIMDGDIDLVASLIETGHANELDDKNNTPLHTAVIFEQEDIVKLLVNADAKINAQNVEGNTPLHYATMINRVEIVQALLKKELSLDIKNKIKAVDIVNVENLTHITPLHLAAQKGNADIVQLLIEAGADMYARNRAGKIALHLAIEEGHTHVAQILICNNIQHPTTAKKRNSENYLRRQAGINGVNAESSLERTRPLHLAAQKDNADIVQLLIKAGAEVNARDIAQRTPLHFAAMNGYTSVTKILIENRADMNARTVLEIVRLGFNDISIYGLLLSGCHGYTPLHYAASLDRTNVVRLLIQHGANLRVQDQDGHTPLHISVKKGSTEIVQLLLEHSADVLAPTIDGDTTLHLAARGIRKKMVTLLLSKSQFPQPEIPTAVEFESCDGKQQVWDLKSLALMNMCSNIEAYNEQDLRKTSQKTPTLFAGYKKILFFVDLNNKKIRGLLAQYDVSDLANYCEYTFIKQMKDFISMKNKYQKTPLDVAMQHQNGDACEQLLKVIKNAESFDQLPEEIQQAATCRVK